jgi:transcriptional regulator with XRE-family HTH domain
MKLIRSPADLAEWRQRIGLTQRAAAAELGVALRTYQEWERGARWNTGEPVEIDRRTTLACAALEKGIAPFIQTTHPSPPGRNS